MKHLVKKLIPSSERAPLKTPRWNNFQENWFSRKCFIGKCFTRFVVKGEGAFSLFSFSFSFFSFSRKKLGKNGLLEVGLMENYETYNVRVIEGGECNDGISSFLG
jgi:hypothetical protein